MVSLGSNLPCYDLSFEKVCSVFRLLKLRVSPFVDPVTILNLIDIGAIEMLGRYHLGQNFDEVFVCEQSIVVFALF